MKKSDYNFKVWESKKDNKWYWNAKSSHNGKVVGAASQGFASKQSALRNANLNGFTP